MGGFFTTEDRTMSTPTKIVWTKRYSDDSGDVLSVEFDASKAMITITDETDCKVTINPNDLEFLLECLNESHECLFG